MLGGGGMRGLVAGIACGLAGVASHRRNRACMIALQLDQPGNENDAIERQQQVVRLSAERHRYA